MKQNGVQYERWPLALRTAVTGSKLEDIAALDATYEQIKREILVEYGETPEQIWRELTKMTQTNESFRQFCMRIQRRFEQFLTLAVTEDSNLQNTLVKYLALDSCSPEMRMYLIEHKIAKLSVEEFQDLGVTFQDAHGRQEDNRQFENG